MLTLAVLGEVAPLIGVPEILQPPAGRLVPVQVKVTVVGVLLCTRGGLEQDDDHGPSENRNLWRTLFRAQSLAKCITNIPGSSVRHEHEALRARVQRFLGLRTREFYCACTESKFREHGQTVCGSHDNNKVCGR